MSSATIETVIIHKAAISNDDIKSYKQEDDSIIFITVNEREFSAFNGKTLGADTV